MRPMAARDDTLAEDGGGNNPFRARARAGARGWKGTVTKGDRKPGRMLRLLMPPANHPVSGFPLIDYSRHLPPGAATRHPERLPLPILDTPYSILSSLHLGQHAVLPLPIP